MENIELVVARGCIYTGDGKYMQGELITLPKVEAERFLAEGILAKREDSPGYKEVPGMIWIRLKESVQSVNDGESGVAGDIRHYNEEDAMNMIEYNLAELYEVPSHV